MSDLIFGRNSVFEYIENMKDFEKLYVQNGIKHEKLNKIIELAKKKKISYEYVDKKKLDKLSDFQNHQGVILLAKDYKYYSLEDVIEYGENQEIEPLLLILDEINDPHNLGAIIRTAEAAGATGVIIPKHRAASVNHTVHKTSAGATSFMRVCMVTNINQTIDILKDKGYWIYGADGHTDKYYDEIDYSGKIGIVIGNEGKGISRLTKEKCDDLIKIPMYGKTESLNASTSAAIIIYGVINQRKVK